jgi:hypothetical protein
MEMNIVISEPPPWERLSERSSPFTLNSVVSGAKL